MSQNASDTAQLSQQKVSGVRTVLRYTGIPPSWLDKRPKLPSRNWSIFLSVASSLVGLYIYDRRQCKQIRQTYVDRVKDLAELPSHPLDAPRKVTVYGAKWPGDEDHEQGIKHFKKYMKPILVAAAVDYELVAGKRLGDIARQVAEDVRLRRRLDTGVDPVPEAQKVLPTYKPLHEVRQRELKGGIVIIGRPTFKEYMAGLKRGWTDGLEKIDYEERLAQELQEDGRFDEPELECDDTAPTANSPPPHISASVFSHLQVNSGSQKGAATPSDQMTDPSVMDAPTTIPPQPPLLLISFTNYIGFSQIPHMLWDFFNHRQKAQAGAEAAFSLVQGATRFFSIPHETTVPAESMPVESASDLDFDREAETYFTKSLKTTASGIEKARKKYYEELPDKLKIARELGRGIREPTKEEQNHPPPTEVELRAERLKKELRWRNDLEGWDLIRPTQPVAWDDGFRDALHLFTRLPRESGHDELQ